MDYNKQVPHEVKYQSVIAKRTFKIMKNGQDVNIQIGSGTRDST